MLTGCRICDSSDFFFWGLRFRLVIFMIIIITVPYLPSMKSNLQLFRECMKEHIPSESIENIHEFKEFVTHLCDSKMLHPLQAKKLVHNFNSSKDIKFPINFLQFEQIIMTQFGDKNLMDMIESFSHLKHKIRQVKGVLNVWKDKGLNTKEKYELESIFQNGNAQVRELFQQLKQEQAVLGNIFQQEQQMIDSLDEWIRMQKVQQSFKNYKDYQEVHHKLIEQMFSKMRVRQVHFKQRINTSKLTKIQVVVGLDSRNDEPVEVTLLPKRSQDYGVLNTQLLTFSARKQLMLSPHFTRFLGHNTHSDPHCFLYFSQHVEGKNLQAFIDESKIQLEEQTPLFKYWASQLYRAFFDIYLMCSYAVQLPIKLSDFVVANGGLKIVAKHIRFDNYREQLEPEFYEAELLQNLGVLILGLLKVDPDHWFSQKKVKVLDNRNIISCMLRAKVGHQHYRDRRVKNYLRFFNAQTHPLLENGSISLGQTIIDNYEAILNYK